MLKAQPVRGEERGLLSEARTPFDQATVTDSFHRHGGKFDDDNDEDEDASLARTSSMSSTGEISHQNNRNERHGSPLRTLSLSPLKRRGSGKSSYGAMEDDEDDARRGNFRRRFSGGGGTQRRNSLDTALSNTPQRGVARENSGFSVELSVQSEMVRPTGQSGNPSSLLGALKREDSEQSFDVSSVHSEAIQPSKARGSTGGASPKKVGGKKLRTRSMGKTSNGTSFAMQQSNGEAVISSSSAHEMPRRASMGDGVASAMPSSSAHELRRASIGNTNSTTPGKTRNRLQIVSSSGQNMMKGNKINSSVSVGERKVTSGSDENSSNARRAKSSSRASSPGQRKPRSRPGSPRSTKGKVSGPSPRTKVKPKVVTGTSLSATANNNAESRPSRSTSPRRTMSSDSNQRSRSKSPRRTMSSDSDQRSRSKSPRRTISSESSGNQRRSRSKSPRRKGKSMDVGNISPKSEVTDMMLTSVLTAGGESSFSPRSAKSSKPKLGKALAMGNKHQRSKSTTSASRSVPDIRLEDNTFTFKSVGEMMPVAPSLDGPPSHNVDVKSIPAIPLNDTGGPTSNHSDSGGASPKKMVMAPSPKVRRPRVAGLPPTLGIDDSEKDEENLFDHLKLDPLDKDGPVHEFHEEDGSSENDEDSEQDEERNEENHDPEPTVNQLGEEKVTSKLQRRHSNDDRQKGSTQRRNSSGGANRPHRKSNKSVPISAGSNHSTGNVNSKKIRVSRGNLEMAKQLASVTKEKDDQLESLQIQMQRMEMENQKLKDALEAATKGSSASSLLMSSSSTAELTSSTGTNESSSSFPQSPSPASSMEESLQRSSKSHPQPQQQPVLVQTRGQIRPQPTMFCLPGLRSLPFWTQAGPVENDTTKVAYQEPSLSWAIETVEQSYETLWNEYQHMAPMVPSDSQAQEQPGGEAHASDRSPEPPSGKEGSAGAEESSPTARNVAARRKSIELKEKLRKQEALVAVLKQRRSSLKHRGSGDFSNQDNPSYAAQLLQGNWDWHSYTLRGKVQENFQQNFPKTIEILEKLGSKNLLLSHQFPYCHTFFSTLHSKSRTGPHSSPTNWRLRLYLPLLVPGNGKECGIRIIGNQTNENNNTIRYWQAGRAVLVDDSYPHEEWNECQTGAPLVVFICDLWHPDVTRAERQELVERFATPSSVDQE